MRRLAGIGVLAAIVALGVFASPVGARNASGSKASSDDIRIVNLNILHGVFCERESNSCQAPDRVDLLAQELEETSCPEIVGLQEVNATIAKELDRIRKTTCGGKYNVVFGGKPSGVDTERVLTTLKVKGTKVIKLAGGFRSASRAVLGSPAGNVTITVTHQDGDPDTPSTTCKICKPPCKTDRGIFDCQTDAAVALAASGGGKNAMHVLMGDFNVEPTSARYQRIVADGWTDSYLAAGNPECVPATGVGCTSGRDDRTITMFTDPNAKESYRIDYIFVKPPGGCDVGFDTPDDADGDGLGTALFFPDPVENGPGGLLYTSDHTGVSADFACT